MGASAIAFASAASASRAASMPSLIVPTVALMLSRNPMEVRVDLHSSAE